MMQRIVLPTVREYVDHSPVELVRNEHTNGRWGILAYNEGGNNITIVDLFDLVDFLKCGMPNDRVDGGFYLTLDRPSTDPT